MSVYKWYRSTNQTQVQRCTELVNKGFGMFRPGQNVVALKFRMDADGEPTTPGFYGVPVGAGSGAGQNGGAAMVEEVRASVIAGDNTQLTSQERAELLLFLQSEAEVDDAWYWDVASPDYGL
jgi:hypothetical protein